MKKFLILSLSFIVTTISAHGGNPLTLQQLKDSAMNHNIAIRSARHSMAAAQQQRKEAFTKFFPSVSGVGAWFNADKGMAKMDIDMSKSLSPEMGQMLGQMLPPEMLASLSAPMSMSMMKNGTIASVSAVQPLFAGGQIVNGNKLARVGEDVSRLQLQLSEQEVERTIERYYWQLVSLGEKMKTLSAVEALLSDIRKDVDVAVKAGVAMRNDLLQVQLRQNEVESQQLTVRNGLSILKLTVAQYCGLHSSSFTVVSEDSTLIPSAILPFGDHNLSVLPEYQLLEKQVEAAKLQKRMALGKNLPSLAVGAGYNYHNLLDNDRTFGMVFATVSVPISDWWGGSHAVKRRQIEQQKAEEQLADNAQLLVIRIQKAGNDVEEARQQWLLAQRSVEQADENLRLNRNYYRAGTCRMSDLLEAQMLYQQALDKRTDAQANYHNRLLDYRQAVGER